MTGEKPHLEAEKRFVHGEKWDKGKPVEGSVRVDVWNERVQRPYDYKFGGARVRPAQQRRYKAVLPKRAQPIREVKPQGGKK